MSTGESHNTRDSSSWVAATSSQPEDPSSNNSALESGSGHPPSIPEEGTTTTTSAAAMQHDNGTAQGPSEAAGGTWLLTTTETSLMDNSSLTVDAAGPAAASSQASIAAASFNTSSDMSPVEMVAPLEQDERSIDGFKVQGRNIESYFDDVKSPPAATTNNSSREIPSGSDTPPAGSIPLVLTPAPGAIPEVEAHPIHDDEQQAKPSRNRCFLYIGSGAVVVVTALAILLVVLLVNRGGEDEVLVTYFEPFNNEVIAEGMTIAFGRALALSKNASIMAVGASQSNNEKGDWRAGAVKIFRNVEDREWRQVGQTLFGMKRKDYFGDSVDLSHDGFTVVIGTTFSDRANQTQLVEYGMNATDVEVIENVGHVEVYHYNETEGRWNQLGQSLYGEEMQDKFGEAVAISADGRKIVVGAVEEAPGKSGLVRVYNYDAVTSTWEQMGRDIVGLVPGDRFGYALDMSDDGLAVAVGGHGHNSGDGYVRVFYYSLASLAWEQRGETIFGEQSPNSTVAFGVSVALAGDGNTVVAGAPARWVPENLTDFGEVHVLEYIDDTWVRKGQLLVGDHVNDNFGWSVDISSDGNVLAAGANRHNGDWPLSGKAKVYEYNQAKWVQVGGNFAGIASNKTRFGLAYSLAVSPDGNYVALQDDGGRKCNSTECDLTGRVRVFQKVQKPQYFVEN